MSLDSKQLGANQRNLSKGIFPLVGLADTLQGCRSVYWETWEREEGAGL